MNDTETLPRNPDYSFDSHKFFSKVCIAIFTIFNVILCTMEGFVILFSGPVLARMYADAGGGGFKVSISLFLHEKFFLVVPILLVFATIVVAFKAIGFKKKIYINLLISAVSIIHSIVVVGVPYLSLIIPMSRPTQ